MWFCVRLAFIAHPFHLHRHFFNPPTPILSRAMKTKRKSDAHTTPFHGPNLHPHPQPHHNDDTVARDEEEDTTTPPPYQEAQQDEEAEEEEEEEEEEEVDEGDGDGEGEGEGEQQSERPKLDDGFYEIEAIRRRRVRKGQLQYLVKWRGWPENANTWEPLENLQACSDVIDAFEDRYFLSLFISSFFPFSVFSGFVCLPRKLLCIFLLCHHGEA